MIYWIQWENIPNLLYISESGSSWLFKFLHPHLLFQTRFLLFYLCLFFFFLNLQTWFASLAKKIIGSEDYRFSYKNSLVGDGYNKIGIMQMSRDQKVMKIIDQNLIPSKETEEKKKSREKWVTEQLQGRLKITLTTTFSSNNRRATNG